jgi:hypothetical protein
MIMEVVIQLFFGKPRVVVEALKNVLFNQAVSVNTNTPTNNQNNSMGLLFSFSIGI